MAVVMKKKRYNRHGKRSMGAGQEGKGEAKDIKRLQKQMIRRTGTDSTIKDKNIKQRVWS